MIRELDGRAFEECVLSAPGREIVEFYTAQGKDPANAMETAAAETAGQTDFFRVNADVETDLASRYVKGATPHYVLFEDGVEITSANGPMSAVQLEKMTTIGEYGAD